VCLFPAGRLALNVFGPIERNPATCALARALELAATPLATLIRGYDAARRNHLISALAQDVGADLAPYAGGDEGLTFPQEVHVVLARS
jgi:hypothetical protein